MPHTHLNHLPILRRRTLRIAVVGSALAALAAALAAGSLAEARPNPKARARMPARIAGLSAPLGTQGRAGAGEDVVVPFRLVDATRILAGIEAEYGIDRNGDDVISEDEYRPARENRLDPRNTRRNQRPQLFTTAADSGATHAFVWRSDADLPVGRFYTDDYLVTPQGRLVPDPDNPGSFLHGQTAGVRIRLRALKTVSGRTTTGPWVTSEAFSLQNASHPEIRVDSVVKSGGTGTDGLARSMTIRWTGIHGDSEDLDGDGVLDFRDGEDIDGDGVLRTRRLGVSFDSHPIRPGENPATMTLQQLEALDWHPCPRLEGAGDDDSVSGAPAGRAVFGTPDGLQWTFVWDAENDGHAQGAGPYILRGRTVDESGARSEEFYVLTGFTR